MKRTIILILLLAIYGGIQAQGKKIWIDLEVGQTFALNKWFDNPDLSNPLRKNSSTDLKARFNWRFYKQIGLYTDLSIGFPYHNKGYKTTNLLDEVDMDKYYTNSNYIDYDDNNEAVFKMTFGLFYRFDFNKFSLTPYLGVGFEDVYAQGAWYTLKEKGNNNMYDVSYKWFTKNSSGSGTLGILSLQLISSYRITRSTDLFLGINYRYSMTKPDFRARISDYYDHSIVDEIYVKGNNTHNLGISLGVSFGK